MGVKVTPEEKDRERGRERLDQLACPHTLRRTATATAARLNATKQGQEVEEDEEIQGPNGYKRNGYGYIPLV